MIEDLITPSKSILSFWTPPTKLTSSAPAMLLTWAIPTFTSGQSSHLTITFTAASQSVCPQSSTVLSPTRLPTLGAAHRDYVWDQLGLGGFAPGVRLSYAFSKFSKPKNLVSVREAEDEVLVKLFKVEGLGVPTKPFTFVSYCEKVESRCRKKSTMTSREDITCSWHPRFPAHPRPESERSLLLRSSTKLPCLAFLAFESG